MYIVYRYVGIKYCTSKCEKNTSKQNYKFAYFFQGDITEDSPGQGNVPIKVHRWVNEVQCSEQVLSLTDELWQYALDNFSTASISLVTKQSAREFYKSNRPQSSLSFHLQSVFTTNRTQETSQNKTIVGLWKRAWNDKAARNVERSPVA